MTSVDRQAVRNQLIGHEGDDAWLYDDATGKALKRGDTVRGNATIGVGHNLFARPLSARIRSAILDEDIDDCLLDLNAYGWFMGLDAVRLRAVIDFRFNVGKAGFLRFPNFIAAMARKDYEQAARELETAPWYHEVQPARAERICAQIRTGVDPA